MYTRSQLRHACFRAKNNRLTEDNKKTLEVVSPLLAEHQTWSTFADKWDLITTKSGEIIIIKPESDYDYVHSTCIEARTLVRLGQEIAFSDPRKENVIQVVENLMLDNMMSWSNYGEAWGVTIDVALKQIRTKLYHVEPTQIEVTQEMIDASRISDPAPLTQAPDTELLAEKMTPEQEKLFKNLISKLGNP